MLGCQSGPGITLGCGPGRLTAVTRRDGGGSRTLFCSYSGRGSGDGILKVRGMASVRGRETAMVKELGVD